MFDEDEDEDEEDEEDDDDDRKTSYMFSSLRSDHHLR